ncbi:hypothetical protein LT337_25610 [Mycolicibacterium fortuitum]|nr:hypothetical protein LT337_25610 [Mycolicibacterium fortuitum]
MASQFTVSAPAVAAPADSGASMSAADVAVIQKALFNALRMVISRPFPDL